MSDEEKLLKSLTKEVKDMENMIKKAKLYKLKKQFKKNLIKSGIVLNHVIPYALASFISYGSVSAIGYNPFSYEKVKENAKIETFETSTGLNRKTSSKDIEYGSNSFEHTTAWKLNDNGLYERTITVYEIDDSIDLSDTDKVLSMTKEEVEAKLNIIDIKTIQKNVLNEEDKIYDEDMLIITRSTEDEDDFKMCNETFFENILDVGFWLALTIVFGATINVINKKLFKLDEKLKAIDESIVIEKVDVSTISEVLKVKKHNLEMIKGTERSEGERRHRR